MHLISPIKYVMLIGICYKMKLKKETAQKVILGEK